MSEGISNLKTLRNESAVQKVVNSLTDAVVSRKLSPGDKLPPESELATAFGVARTSVREAVKILTHLGVLELRRGNGIFVSSGFKDSMIDPVVYIIVLNQSNDIKQLTVIECVGKIRSIEQAIAIAGKKPVVMMFGLTAPADQLVIRPFDLFKKEIVLKASYINPYTQKRAIDLIDSGRIDVTSVIAGIEPLERLPEILCEPKYRAKGKIIINP